MTRTRIVLADDHPDVAEQLRDLLSAEYDVVAIVRDGRELVEAVQRLEPDVIVADIAMPTLSGLGAVRAIREQGSNVRCVFVSVKDERAVIQHALSLGALAYVLKCDAGEELLPAMRATLSAQRYVSATARVAAGLTSNPAISTMPAETKDLETLTTDDLTQHPKIDP